MKLDINLDTKEILEVAQQKAHEKAKNIALNLVSEHFDNGQYYGHKKGFGYLQIQECIDSLLTSDSLNEKIKDLCDVYWGDLLNKAVLHQLERKAQKEANRVINGNGKKA